jgi:hypothetical protein
MSSACGQTGVVVIAWLQAFVGAGLLGVAVMCLIIIRRQALISVLLKAQLKELEIEMFRGGRR